MASTYSQIHRYGTQAQYDALKQAEALNENYLYFTSDTGKLYKGSVDYTDSLISVAAVPNAGVAGKIYFETSTGAVKAYVGGEWKIISYPISQSISALNASTAKIVSEKAIVEYVAGQIGGDGVVAGIEQKMNAGTAVAGTLLGTMGDASTFDIHMAGLAINPTWNPTTRQLVIPVTNVDGTTTNVTADIGKDIFLDPEEGANYFDPDTKEIVLTLNDADPAAVPPKAATVIRIPASALYNDYTGGSTNSGTVSIDGTTHEISFDVNINSSTANAISFDSSGLMVDLSAYATTASVETIREGLEEKIDAATATLSASTAALGELEANYNATTAALAGLTSNYNATTATVDGLVNNYNATTADLATLTSNYNATTATLDTLVNNYNATTADLATLTSNYNATTATVATNTANISALADATTGWAGFSDAE